VHGQARLSQCNRRAALEENLETIAKEVEANGGTPGSFTASRPAVVV